MEAAAHNGTDGPFLTADQAVAALDSGKRHIFFVSHAWLQPGEPDPEGFKFQQLTSLFATLSTSSVLPADATCGIFYDFSSLPQLPRTPEEQHKFEQGLSVMPALYASAVGTSVIKLMHVPRMPKQLNGLVMVDVASAEHAYIDELWLKREFGKFGKVAKAEMPSGGGCFATVVFAGSLLRPAHSRAKAAVKASKATTDRTRPVAHLGYNKRSYHRRGWVSVARVDHQAQASILWRAHCSNRFVHICASGWPHSVRFRPFLRRPRLKR